MHQDLGNSGGDKGSLVSYLAVATVKDLGILGGGLVAAVTLDSIHVTLGIIASAGTVAIVGFRIYHEWRHRND